MLKNIIILLTILFFNINSIFGDEKNIPKYNFGQIVKYVDSKKVGILTGFIKSSDGKYKPFYEIGIEINIINPKDNKPSKIYMFNREGKNLNYKKDEPIVLYDVVASKSNIIMASSTKSLSLVYFDIFNNLSIPIFPIINNLPNLAIAAGTSSASKDSCLGYILVGTYQAYISNISQTAGTSAVANNYTVSWTGNGSVFVIYDAVVEIK